jgi:hypothetical protein
MTPGARRLNRRSCLTLPPQDNINRVDCLDSSSWTLGKRPPVLHAVVCVLFDNDIPPASTAFVREH